MNFEYSHPSLSMQSVIKFFVIFSVFNSILCTTDAKHVGQNGKQLRWIVMKDELNRLHYVDLSKKVPIRNVDESEVTFYYTSRFMKEGDEVVLRKANVSLIVNTDFNPNHRTAFIVHGWFNSKDSRINAMVSSAFKEAGDWNIFIVDWSSLARTFYPTSKGSVSGVGEILADFISELSTLTSLSLDNVVLVGHSLGAHVCGKAGTELKGKISVIVGMDPASPLFSYENLEDRLDPSDAVYVQIIHTNGGELAFEKPLGHSDFYPNGGQKQVGCGWDLFGLCAHSRSYMYFSESVRRNKFRATQCDDYSHYKDDSCNFNQVAYMGGNHINTTVRGTYFLNTAPENPFALG